MSRSAPHSSARDAIVWPYRILRWGLALIFLYAGAVKLADPEAFAVIIEAYGLVPDSLLMPLAVLLPVFEVLAAIGLVFDLRGSLTAIAALLGIFMLVLGYGIRMGLDVDCGCFGPDDPEGRAYAGIRPALYRDFFMAGGVVLLYGMRYRYGFGPPRRRWTRLTSFKEETNGAMR